jgi:hypothetical protein
VLEPPQTATISAAGMARTKFSVFMFLFLDFPGVTARRH